MRNGAKIILITGARFRSEVRAAMQSQYALRKILCKTVLVREGLPDPDLEQLKRYPGYVLVDSEQPVAMLEPWQTVTVSSGGCHSRLTLVKGTGLGKSTIAKALQAHLSGRGISMTTFPLERLDKREIAHLKEIDRVIVTTNLENVPLDPAFTITVEGGQPFPGMHRL